MNTANVVVSEENVPYIRIAFPAVKIARGMGTPSIPLSADEYVLTTVGKSYQLESREQVGRTSKLYRGKILVIRLRLWINDRSFMLKYRLGKAGG